MCVRALEGKKRLELSTPILVHGSHSPCIDLDVKRSRSRSYQMRCWRGYAARCDCLGFYFFGGRGDGLVSWGPVHPLSQTLRNNKLCSAGTDTATLKRRTGTCMLQLQSKQFRSPNNQHLDSGSVRESLIWRQIFTYLANVARYGVSRLKHGLL